MDRSSGGLNVLACIVVVMLSGCAMAYGRLSIPVQIDRANQQEMGLDFEIHLDMTGSLVCIEFSIPRSGKLEKLSLVGLVVAGDTGWRFVCPIDCTISRTDDGRVCLVPTAACIIAAEYLPRAQLWFHVGGQIGDPMYAVQLESYFVRAVGAVDKAGGRVGVAASRQATNAIPAEEPTRLLPPLVPPPLGHKSGSDSR